MRHQSGEAENVKKGPDPNFETGFEAWDLWTEAVEERLIATAEFFHPEEFRYRRKISSPEE